MFTFAALIEYSVAAYLEKRKTILQQSQQGADLGSRLEMVRFTISKTFQVQLLKWVEFVGLHVK